MCYDDNTLTTMKIVFPFFLLRKMASVNIFRKIVIIRSIFVRMGCSLTENQICVIFNTYRTINWLFVAVCHFQKIKKNAIFSIFIHSIEWFFRPVVQTYETYLIDMSHNGYNFDVSTLFPRAFSILLNIKTNLWPLCQLIDSFVFIENKSLIENWIRWPTPSTIRNCSGISNLLFENLIGSR